MIENQLIRAGRDADRRFPGGRYSLTGSGRAGTSVGEQAGRNLKKVILEPGGSDSAIILKGAPLEFVAEQILLASKIDPE